MKRFQFDQLCVEWQRYRNALLTACVNKTAQPVPPHIRLYISSGPHQGQILNVSSIKSLRLHGLVNGHTVYADYQNLEQIDEHDRPVIMPITDMTGRELHVDTWICYSRKTAYSHSLEIGRITKLTPSGGLKVVPRISDGVLLQTAKWKKNCERLINNPARTIKLPVETATMTYWLLRDFDMSEPA